MAQKKPQAGSTLTGAGYAGRDKKGAVHWRTEKSQPIRVLKPDGRVANRTRRRKSA